VYSKSAGAHPVSRDACYWHGSLWRDAGGDGSVAGSWWYLDGELCTCLEDHCEEGRWANNQPCLVMLLGYAGDSFP